MLNSRDEQRGKSEKHEATRNKFQRFKNRSHVKERQSCVTNNNTESITGHKINLLTSPDSMSFVLFWNINQETTKPTLNWGQRGMSWYWERLKGDNCWWHYCINISLQFVQYLNTTRFLVTYILVASTVSFKRWKAIDIRYNLLYCHLYVCIAVYMVHMRNILYVDILIMEVKLIVGLSS